MADVPSNAEHPSADPAGDGPDHSTFDIYCHECGYNLRGNESVRCPECGEDSPALQNADPRIPWVHRKELGTLRAFRKTVWFATFHPRKLSRDVYLDIDFRESQKFRWWTIAAAMFWLVGLTISLYAIGPVDPVFWGSDVADFLKMYWPSAVLNVLVFIYIILATGVPSLFFDYKDLPINLRNNAVALSYYCCAPLAWWPFPLALSMFILSLQPFDMRSMWVAIPLSTLMVLAPFTTIFLWCFQLSGIASRVLRNQTGRKAWLTIGTPMLWFFTAIVVFGLIPLAGFYAWVLIDALS